MTADLLLHGDDLGQALRSVAVNAPGTTVAYPELDATITNAELLRHAEGLARALVAGGVRPGVVVGLLARSGPDLLAGLFGIWLAGAAASVLPQMVLSGDLGLQSGKLGRIVDAAGMRHLVVDPRCESSAGHLLALRPGLNAHLVNAQGPRALSLPDLSPDGIAVVQFTSGTTSSPRGVVLTHRAVIAGLTAVVVSSESTPADVFVQWMPYYHDMGLFGHLSYLLNGARTHVFEPLALLRRPADLLRYFAAVRGTAFTGMNFAYDLLADAATPDVLDGLDLSSWQLAYNGGEPVRAATVERFEQRFRSAGVGPNVMYPVYGMAEATLCVTFPKPGSVPASVTVNRSELGTTGAVHAVQADHAQAKTLVSVGQPVHGIEIRLVSEDGTPLGDGQLGEMQIRGPMVTRGYLKDPAATAALFDGDWLRTGDLCVRLGVDHYVAGRRKEMVIVHGTNYFPDDAEAAARVVPGIYRRRVAAAAQIDTDGSEHIAVIAETVAKGTDRDALKRAIHRRVVADLGTPQVRVHLVRPRFLTRTTSGKWMRLRAAEQIMEGDQG